MRPRSRWVFGFLALAVVLAGCNRLKDEKTITVDPAEIKKLEIDAQTSDLKLTVSGHSADAPVTVCIVTKDDEDAAVLAMSQHTAPAKTLASAPAGKDFNLEATLPSGKAGTVLLGGTAKTDVKVTIIGK